MESQKPLEVLRISTVVDPIDDFDVLEPLEVLRISTVVDPSLILLVLPLWKY